MKKTCNGCAALRTGQGEIGTCTLGYEIKYTQKVVTMSEQKMKIDIAAPIEICPKPRTIKELMNTPHKTIKYTTLE